MRAQVLLVTLAVLVALAALPLSKGKEEGGGAAVAAVDAKASSWPCCDNCGFCYRSYPPQCQCLDFSSVGCHPECRQCIRYTTDDGVDIPPVHVYRCADILFNFCDRRCTPAAVAAA